MPKTDASKTDASKTSASKTDASKTDASKTSASKASASKASSSQGPARKAAQAAEAGTPAGTAGFDGPDLGQAAEAGQRSLAALANLHSRSFRDALKFNAELLDFAQRRISADIQASDRLARCRSVSEAMDTLGEFYRGALQDYAEETTALVRLGAGIATESVDASVEASAAEAARAGRKKEG